MVWIAGDVSIYLGTNVNSVIFEHATTHSDQVIFGLCTELGVFRMLIFKDDDIGSKQSGPMLSR